MKKWISCCLMVTGFLLVYSARGQSIFSFSGSGKGDSSLTFSFYNPLAAGSVVLPGDTGVHYINSGPMQLYVDTTNNCDLTSAASLDIDSIPQQMIFYNTPRTFFIKSAKLGINITGQSWYVDTSIIKGRRPLGTLLFNRCQYFSYTTNTDTLNFYLRFVLINSNGVADTSAPVLFNIVPTLPFETSTFGIGGQQSLPDVTDPSYIVKTKSRHANNTALYPNRFNFRADSLTTYSYSAVSVTLDGSNTDIAPLCYTYGTTNYDLDTLNIYAETVTIDDGLFFPGTTINIYAKNLIFQDVNGKHAFICTTPLQNPIILNSSNTSQGLAGLNGGNINLHILNFVADPGKRFITSGGNGQGISGIATSYMGTPGNGGNVSSNVDISQFVLNDGGYSGNEGYDVTGSVTYKGNSGNYNYYSDSAATWLHPNFFQIIVNYYKDAFYNGITTPISQNLQWYSNIFDSYSANGSINQIAPNDLMMLSQSVNEIRQIFYNLANNLDYFGNPPGWVPMLSFEVSADVYQTEVNNDMNILYLQHLINSTNASLKDRVKSFKDLVTQANNLATSNLATYNNIANVVIPDEKQQIANNQAKIDSITAALTNLKNQINAEAQQEYDNQHSTFGEIMGGLATVCSMIPTPITEGAGEVLDLSSQIVGGDYAASFNNGQSLANNIVSVVGPITSIVSTAAGNVEGIASDVSNGVSDIGSNLGTLASDVSNNDISDAFNIGDDISNQYKSLFANTQNQISGVSNSLDSVVDLYNSVLNVGKDQLSAIKNQLITSNPLIQQYGEEIQQIQSAQQQLAQEIKQSTQQMLVAQNNVFSNLAAVSNLSSAEYNANAAINHYLSVYANNLASKAMERLKLYHYYMVKAFEYRTLKPLNTNLNLQSISNQIQTLLIDSNYTWVQPSVYTNVLATVYNQEVTNIMDSIYNYYEANKPAQTITSTYRLSNAEVATLNSGGSVTLNLVQDGVFPPSEEDIRIVGLGVSKIVFNPIASNRLGNTDEIDFNFAYPNYSRLKKNGIIFNFNNYNLNTTNPINWTSRYDLNSQQLSNAQTSAQDNSLIAQLLSNGGHSATDNDVLLYSLPGAWADINLSMTHFTDSTDLVTADSVWIQVNYQYEPKPANQVNIEINASNKWFAPTFQIDTKDNNGNKSGIGDVHRAYTLSSGNFVTATAPMKMGAYQFDSWSDQAGNPVSFNTDVDTVSGANGGKNMLRFSTATDRSFKAKYVFQGPILNLPDTVFLGDSLHYQLHIQNTGNGPIYWNLDSIATMCSWLHDSGALRGINDTTISLYFDKKPDSLINRIGKLDVSSIETENLHNYVVFVQGVRPKNVTDSSNNSNNNGNGNGNGNGNNGGVIITGGDSLKLIWPNPTTFMNINIEFVNPLVYDANVTVLNSNGEFVMSAQLVKGLKIYNLDLSRLTNGNYYVKISNNTGLNVTEQIMIRR